MAGFAPSLSAIVTKYPFAAFPDTASRVTLNTTFPPSVADAFEIVSVGSGSSLMIPTLVPVTVRPPDVPLRLMVLSSSKRSLSVGVRSKST